MQLVQSTIKAHNSGMTPLIDISLSNLSTKEVELFKHLAAGFSKRNATLKKALGRDEIDVSRGFVIALSFYDSVDKGQNANESGGYFDEINGLLLTTNVNLDTWARIPSEDQAAIQKSFNESANKQDFALYSGSDFVLIMPSSQAGIVQIDKFKGHAPMMSLHNHFMDGLAAMVFPSGSFQF